MSDKIMENIMAKREKFTPSEYAHSSWLGLDSNGEPITQSRKDICYMSLFRKDSNLKSLFFFFGEGKVKSRYKPEIWADFIINRSQYSEAFITKDVEEGLKIGFELNLEVDYGMYRTAPIALRHVFELGEWSFAHYKDLGFGDFESYLLCSNYCVLSDERGTRYLRETNYPTNHVVIPPKASLDSFMGEFYNKDFSIRCNKCSDHITINTWGVDGDIKYTGPTDLECFKGLKTKTLKVVDAWGEESFNREKVPVFNKENVDLILKEIG